MGKSAGLVTVLVGALFALSLDAAPAADDAAVDAATADAARCASLDSEWKAAEGACSANANLGRARALAREAENKCKSADSAQRKLGVSKFQSALRLCRKPDSAH